MATVMLGNPAKLRAQATNEPPSPSKALSGTNPAPKPEKKPVAGPFHGKLLALDKTARTITVGKRTFQITSETRIKKAGKPATFEEGVVGQPVSGYVKPTQNGKWVAVSVNFGPKPQDNGTSQKKPKTVKESN